tara:strand:- start:199 stop:510 length:312 start_codon:yes stop_codon:yes gene_type:complete
MQHKEVRMNWKQEEIKREKNRLSKIKKLRQQLSNEQMDALLSVATVLTSFAQDYVDNDFTIGDGRLPNELIKAKDTLENCFHMTRGYGYQNPMFEKGDDDVNN